MLTRIVRLVGAGALLAAAAFAAPATATAGGGCHGQPGAVHTDGATSVVRMDVCSFAPNVARVAVGTEVRFLNTDVQVHVVTGERQEWGSGGQPLDPGEEARHRFDQPGVFPYSCPLHPGMVGAIVVGDAAPAAAAPVADSAPGGPASSAAAQAPAGGIAPAALLAVGLGGLVAGASVAGLLVARRRSMA